MTKYPSLKEEKKLWRRGYKVVAGLDEAGRGPLAGPVVAAAVMIKNQRVKIEDLPGARDSKQLTQRQREKLYEAIVKHPDLRWGIGIVSEKVIDKINILEAAKLAMVKALKRMKVDCLILDGNMKLALPLAQKPIVKGDQKVFSCAAASILAKVTRDRIMRRYHKKYSPYRFDLHKGYGTRLHLRMLRKHKPCPIHRRSFRPVQALEKV
ncbi:MAG: ribonuclease HII [Candidatus Nealsonbacteria bacterium]|nr:ribonuclease HII [Candidatus Nealsonbacteria bacterium]